MKILSSLFLISLSLFLLIGQASNINAYTKKRKRQKTVSAQSPPVDYYVISLGRVANEEEVEIALDRAGAKGWILVEVIEGVQANRLYIFKKMNIFDNSPQLIQNVAEIKEQLDIVVKSLNEEKAEKTPKKNTQRR
ncbi:MAG: hypothetical protein GY756_26105 [bacterium]|nr:hypothetical protein [bacterium]